MSRVNTRGDTQTHTQCEADQTQPKNRREIDRERERRGPPRHHNSVTAVIFSPLCETAASDVQTMSVSYDASDDERA